jgi:hypothetical protein
MFCPRCATENAGAERFCRRCGLSLPAVRLALEGRVEEAQPLVRKAQNSAGWALMIFCFTIANLVINYFLGDSNSLVFTAVVGVNLLLLFLILAAVRLAQAQKLVAPEKTAGAQAAPDAPLATDAETNPQLPPAPATDPLEEFRAPGSVTEDATLKLAEPVKTRRPRPE